MWLVSGEKNHQVNDIQTNQELENQKCINQTNVDKLDRQIYPIPERDLK